MCSLLRYDNSAVLYYMACIYTNAINLMSIIIMRDSYVCSIDVVLIGDSMVMRKRHYVYVRMMVQLESPWDMEHPPFAAG